MMNFSTLKLLAVLLALCLVALPAAARPLSEVLVSNQQAGSLHAFAAEGRPHSVKEVAAAFDKGESGKVFRAPKAMALFKFVFETQLGQMSNAQLAALLRSDRVQVISCAGTIRTTGYDAVGNVKWFSRQCEAGEQLIVLDGVVVASLWCLNPVEVAVKTASPQGTPCSEWHPLPEQARGKTWVYTTNPAMLKACNPKITLCPGCEEFIAGQRPFKPEGAFKTFIDQSRTAGGRVKGLSTTARPTGFWTNPGTTLFYCLEAWGRSSRVDPLPAR